MKPADAVGLTSPFSNQDPWLRLDCRNPPSLKRGDYYILSNDCADRPILLRTPATVPVAFIGVSSPHVLHALAVTGRQRPVGRVVFLDPNPVQLAHLRRLVGWIGDSRNRLEFLERVFCIRAGSTQESVLRKVPRCRPGAIRGAKEGATEDRLMALERSFWKDVHFHCDDFRQKYGRAGLLTSSGIETTQNVVGGIDRCLLTAFAGTKLPDSEWPFTLGWGSSFLRDEQAFDALRRLLTTVPLSFVHSDLDDLMSRCAGIFRYTPMVLWTSNIFNDFFADKFEIVGTTFSHLSSLGAQREPEAEFDIYVLQDQRDTWNLPPWLRARAGRHRSRLSVHARTFREVASRIQGSNCLEVTNVRAWIDQDHGESKLPTTDYSLLTAEEPLPVDREYSTIFLHILAGHGVPHERVIEVCRWAKRNSRMLLILEHHGFSPELFTKPGLVTPAFFRNVLGPELELKLIPGRMPLPRNFLLVYRGDRAGSLIEPADSDEGCSSRRH